MFIGVQFFAEYSKTYTYICKRTIKIGDFVVVPSGTGRVVAKVTRTHLDTPMFQCKEIIKKVRL